MKNRAVVGTLATVLVVGLIVAGLFAVGSPATARKFKADQERRNRLSQLHYVLASHVRTEGTLPSSLENINEDLLQPGFDARRDPESGEFFEYRKESDRSYEVCATFYLSSDDRRARSFGPYPGEVTHEPGRNCYDRTVTAEDLQNAPGFFERPPLPERVTPATVEPSPSPTVQPTESPEPSPAAADEAEAEA